MGRKEIKTETDCEEENKPKEVEQVTNSSPVGAVDVFWVHLNSLSKLNRLHQLTTKRKEPIYLAAKPVQNRSRKDFATNFT